MGIGAKAINLGMRLSGVKRLYALPEEEFLQKVREVNAKRGFFMPGDAKAHYEDELIFGRYHCLKVMLGNAPSERAILFFFGGGMVLDSDRQDIDVARKLAQASGCDVWFPYYPLCPEHSVREAMEMGFECYRKMVGLYGAGNVSTCGFSSGGMLALAMGLYNNAYGCGLPQPRHVVAVSPGEVPADDAALERMRALNATDNMVDCAFMEKVEKFMRKGEDLPDWMIHPSMGDYSGFPKTYFYYSADECLYAGWPNFEAGLRRHGVPYEMSAQAGMFHCYCMIPYFKEGKEKFAEIAAVLGE